MNLSGSAVRSGLAPRKSVQPALAAAAQSDIDRLDNWRYKQRLMIDLLNQKRPELISLCRKHHVRSLAVFGSAAIDTFDTNHSDLDFIVEFE